MKLKITNLMTRLILSVFATALGFFLLTGCKKNNPDPPKDPGVFTATVDGQAWAPTLHRVIYFSKLGKIYLDASGGNYELQVGALVNFANPASTYLLQSNGDDYGRLGSTTGTFHTDVNIADAGGSLVVTKFDLAQQKLSGTLNFAAYNSDRSEKIVVTVTEITDIPITIDTLSSNGTEGSFTITGATTATVQSKNFMNDVVCASALIDNTVEVRFGPVLQNMGRHLMFKIPVTKALGTYPIQPNKAPYWDCFANHFVAEYKTYDGIYYPVSGSFTLVSINTTTRQLTASFSLTVKDEVRQETIQITNGQLNLNGWRKLGN
jgi:hypothetical protein